MFLFIICLLSQPTLCIAGAWLLEEGEKRAITSLRFYESQNAFDTFAQNVDASLHSQLLLSSYIEYGFSEYITLGLEPHLVSYNDKNVHGPLSEKDAVFTDSHAVSSDVFLRYAVFESAQYVFSIEPMVQLPLLAHLHQGGSGYRFIPKTHLYALKASFGHSFSKDLDFFIFDLGKKHSFLDVGLSFRRPSRFTTAVRDHFVLDIKQGLYLTDNVLIEQTANIQFSSEFEHGFAERALLGVSFSGVLFLDQKTALQFSYTEDVLGRNIRMGKSTTLSLWWRF